MSGLLALLDDVAAIAKLAAAQVDDIAGQAAKVGSKVGATVLDDAAKAGTKAAGVVIDDAAVTPKYVTGLPATRELPIIWKIARASFFNKLVILLPAALLLSAFAPWLITPLLMLGGGYLCFEGAEKIWHVLHPHAESQAQEAEAIDAAHLEEQRVKGAIKTDFILSAEIMTIALSVIESPNIWMQAATLALVGVMITAVVYGAVAIIVKMDDLGLWLTQVGKLGLTRALGRGIVKFMPWLLRGLTIVGTAAMLWVGGSIIIHSLAQMGWHAPEEYIHDIAVSYGNHQPALEWIITAGIDFVLGFLWGLILIPVGVRMVAPIWAALFGGAKAGAH